MKLKILMLTVIAAMAITSCQKENVSPDTNQIEENPITQTRDGDGPQGTDPNAGTGYTDYITGYEDNWDIVEIGSSWYYGSLSIWFYWNPVIMWNEGDTLDPFVYEIYEIDCSTEEILGTALYSATGSTEPLGEDGAGMIYGHYFDDFGISLPYEDEMLGTTKCYILQIKTPYGTIIYQRIFI